MNNDFQKKGWGMDTNTAHIEHSPITLVRETTTNKSYGDYVKQKLRRDPTSSTS